MTPVADSIVTQLRLYPRIKASTLINIEMHHSFAREAVVDALDDLVLIGRVAVEMREDGAWLSLIPKPWDEDVIPAASFAAADSYRLKHCPTWRDRAMVIVANVWAWIANVWDRIRFRILGGLVCMIVMTGLAIDLCAQDVPPWVLRGIAAVETNSTWRDMGDITWRDQRVGSAGEVGPWQLSPAVLRDLKVYDKRDRVHRQPVFAESLTRAWLLRLYRTTGCWDQAVAAYHAGLGKRRESFAITYAADVRASGDL